MKSFESSSVLVVDDDMINITLLENALEDMCKVVSATSGEQALSVIDNDPPDLILLDINLPDMNGYDICSRVKSNPDTMSIPIMFVTGDDSDESELQGLQLGALDYLRKPFQTALVKARVSNLLDLKQKTDLLEAYANIDGLTNIPNRRSFDRHLADEWSHAQRKGRSIGLILIDIDFFKQYNDHYGHAIGDSCLKRVAGCIQLLARRSSDHVARFGGEEFAVIVRECEPEDVVQLCEKLRSGIERLQIKHDKSEVAKVVTISLGAAMMYPKRKDKPESLIVTTDQCLYDAKKLGRNTVITGGEKTRA